MIIGVPKEIKNNENRVSLTPAGVAELTRRGHQVYVQHAAGLNSGFTDEEYVNASAQILPTIEEVYAIAEMICKVKEPIAPEYKLIREGQILFTYFHLASDLELTKAMLASGATCIAYETVEDRQGNLPLLTPMSEIAGRMAAQEGARFLEAPQGGPGILMGGVPGVRPARVLVLGGGVVGTQAALIAAGMGADVTICDISLPRLRQLNEFMPRNVRTLYSSIHNIELELPHSDLIIGAVLIRGAITPHLITRNMLQLMREKTVMVDVAIDQGGCFETSHPTTHSEPIYTVDGIIHYCVANIPGAVPRTSTIALTNATLPYTIQLADLGWEEACRRDKGLAEGVNVCQGKITYPAVAEAFRGQI
ncbi:alanine dehydrogenase [uncultured Bacteroides sp.]|uniref:alanine dehydrogenase n=1 Tax=uncultured Bacteroides sp. TaxID=162156 RepID=UPI00262329B3|nr:alanine dehydrogenase [uncultured Bacteroides sp.]